MEWSSLEKIGRVTTWTEPSRVQSQWGDSGVRKVLREASRTAQSPVEYYSVVWSDIWSHNSLGWGERGRTIPARFAIRVTVPFEGYLLQQTQGNSQLVPVPEATLHFVTAFWRNRLRVSFQRSV